MDVGLSKADAPLNWFAALLAFTHNDDVCSVGGIHKTYVYIFFLYSIYYYYKGIPWRVADLQVKRVYLFRNEICELHAGIHPLYFRVHLIQYKTH